MKLKRVCALLTAFALTLSLCACGEGKDSPAASDPSERPAPEYVYAAEHHALPQSFSDYMPIAQSAGGLFLVNTVKVGENIPEGMRAEYEGQYDIKEPRLYFMDDSGAILPLESYAPVSSEYDRGGKKYFMQSRSINALFENPDGTITTLEGIFSSWTEEDGLIDCGVQDWYLRTLDSNGAELSCAKLDTEKGEYVYTSYARLDRDGRLVVPIGDGDICVFSQDGELLYALPFGGYIYSLARLRDGRVAALGYDPESPGVWLTLKLVDSAQGELRTMELAPPDDTYSLIDGCGDYDLYYCSHSMLYGYREGDESAEELLNWLECDIDCSRLQFLRSESVESFSGLTSGRHAELFTLSRVPAETAAQKERLTLAALYADYNLQNAIIDFNRTSDSCRIELRDYSEYNTRDDWNAGRTKLLTEIMAGNTPDILAIEELPYTRLAAKGLLEDLWPYIEGDGEFLREDYFPNVMAALEIDGGLYAAVPCFGVQTVAGASSVVGDTPGWTYEDYFAALAKMPEGCEGFDLGVTKETMLDLSVSLDTGRFVDWARGECRFDSEEFIALLNYADSFPAALDADFVPTPDDSSAARIAAGKQMLCSAPFTSTDFMLYDYDMMFGGDVTFIGYPTGSGVGSVITLTEAYAMCRDCKNKDAAWQFLRTFLTEEYQAESFGLPTNKKAFERSLAKAMEVLYEQDANGNYLLDENGERIPLAIGGVFDGITQYSIYATTPRQAEQLRAAIADAQGFFEYDSNISEIVLQGAAPFFAGQKSAEAVAKLIQSKANIYINEQR